MSIKNKILGLGAVGAAVAPSFAQDAGSMTTYNDPASAVTAIGQTASTAFGTFSTTIVPMLLGALVLIGGLQLGKWIIKKIRP